MEKWYTEKNNLINKKAQREIDDFAIPPRDYSDTELADFHSKIQRFWGEPRQVELSNGLSGTAQKFNHQDLHVAYGSATKVKHGLSYVYLYNDRSKDFDNLWKQYEEWRKKQDWIDNKRSEGLEEMAKEVAF